MIMPLQDFFTVWRQLATANIAFINPACDLAGVRLLYLGGRRAGTVLSPFASHRCLPPAVLVVLSLLYLCLEPARGRTPSSYSCASAAGLSF